MTNSIKHIPQTKPQDVTKVSTVSPTMKEAAKIPLIARTDQQKALRLQTGLQLKMSKVNRGYN